MGCSSVLWGLQGGRCSGVCVDGFLAIVRSLSMVEVEPPTRASRSRSQKMMAMGNGGWTWTEDRRLSRVSQSGTGRGGQLEASTW